MVAKLVAILIVGILACALPGLVLAQHCGCPPNLCCSKWGYCGLGGDYCGAGCQSGPCYHSGGGASIGEVVTKDFFHGILNQADESCAGKKFYSRASFLDALNSYPKFGQDGSDDDSKREIAAFFAHVTYETGHLCHIEKSGFNGLKNSEAVANDPGASFKTGLSFWMKNVHPVIINKGFGASIQAVNGVECKGGNEEAVKARIKYFKDYCNQLGVSPGQNLYC